VYYTTDILTTRSLGRYTLLHIAPAGPAGGPLDSAVGHRSPPLEFKCDPYTKIVVMKKIAKITVINLVAFT